MLFRRLYSSLSTRAAACDAGATASHKARSAGTRGRARPVRAALPKRKDANGSDTTTSTSTSTSAAAGEGPHVGRGRKLRRGILARTDLSSTQARTPAVAAVPGFEPVQLYPAQAGLHLGLTPAHMPLPLALGTRGYTSRDAGVRGPLFERPHRPSGLDALSALPEGGSGLGEHLRVARAFAHPSLAHHLARAGAPTPTASSSILDIHADSEVAGRLDAAASSHASAATSAWEAALARLGATETPAPAPEVTAAAAAADQAKLDSALAGLNGLLARLDTGADAADAEHVNMDSVKRKRKKKMNKHKYKKRRKETRALRKRLGK